MQSRKDPMTMILALGVGIYVALMLEYVAHSDLGFSQEQTRGAAIASTIPIAGLLAMDYLRKALRKVKVKR